MNNYQQTEKSEGSKASHRFTSMLIHHRTQGGGAEGVHLREQANGFAKLGVKVNVFSIFGDSLAEPVASVNANTPQAPSKGRAFAKNLASKMPPSLFELLEIGYNFVVFVPLLLRAVRLQPTLIYERYSLFCFVGVLVGALRKIPVVLEVNDSACVERVRPLTLTRIGQAMERYIFRKASGLVFVSTEFHKTCETHHGELAHAVINQNAVNPEHFAPEQFNKQDLREEFGLTAKWVCGYVGAFVFWHGVPEFATPLVAKLKQLEAQGRRADIQFLMVGNGVTYDEVRQIVSAADCEEYFVFPGQVPHKKIPQYLAAMDIGVIPNSNNYGSPMKLFEYMAMQVPSVCPSYPPIAEVLEHEVTGWLYDPLDYQAGVELITSLIDSPQEIARVAAQARDYVLRERTWETNAQRTIALLERSAN